MVEITNFKKYPKNTLQGFFDLKLTSIGLEVRACCLLEKNGERWIQLPSKSYTKEDGTQAWTWRPRCQV